MARRVGSRKGWHTNLCSTLTILFWLPAIVNSGGYDDSSGGSNSGSSGSTGSSGSSGGSSDGSAGGVDINDYASNNGQIPNHLVSEPTVSCGAESVSIDLQTTRPFGGRIFVKGYSQDANCMLNGSGAKVHGFSINFDQCGLRRTRELNGVGVSATVVVSFHPIFITKADRAYKVSCFYMEARKTLGQNLEVSEMTTKPISTTAALPVCRYEILNAPNGQPVRYAKIGDQVYHKWTCDTDVNDIYCMRVHSCTVNDGQGGEPVYVLDENGCEIDRYVLQNLEYPGDLMSGQWSYVFKFADKPTLHFNCQIELALKDREAACTKTHPQCPSGHKGAGQSGYGEQSTGGSDGYAGATRPGHSQTEVTPSHYSAETSPYGDGSAEVHEAASSRPGNPPGFMPPRHGATTQGFTPGIRGSRPNEVDYKRIVKRDDKQKVADFDLPEQSLVVIEIDDENRSAAESLLSRKSHHHSTATSNTICLSSAILAGLFGICAVLCGVIAIFFFAALRKHREAFQKSLLKF